GRCECIVPLGTHASWSSDGKFVAFVKRGNELWRCRADGSSAERLLQFGGDDLATDRSYATAPEWSPSGRFLFFKLGFAIETRTRTWMSGEERPRAKRPTGRHRGVGTVSGVIDFATREFLVDWTPWHGVAWEPSS